MDILISHLKFVDLFFLPCLLMVLMLQDMHKIKPISISSRMCEALQGLNI